MLFYECEESFDLGAPQVDGLHLRVDMATGAAGTAEAKSYSRGRSIFVGNLGFAAQVTAAYPAPAS